MLPGDMKLLYSGVAGERDDFHPVQERFRNRVRSVCGADEEHVGQIIGNVHIVVCKCIVLLRIQYFQECACRISAIVLGQLVHLIQHHDRVGGAAALHSLHDPPRHGADIGPAVAADLRFVADASQTDADIFTAQRAGNALSDTCLARAGRAHKEQDGAVLLLVQSHDGELLDDALLDFPEPVVVFVQDCFRLVQIDGFYFGSLP